MLHCSLKNSVKQTWTSFAFFHQLVCLKCNGHGLLVWCVRWPVDLETLESQPISAQNIPNKTTMTSEVPWARSHLHLASTAPPTASFNAWSSCPHLPGNFSLLGTNETIPSQNYKYSSWHHFHYSQVSLSLLMLHWFACFSCILVTLLQLNFQFV